MRNENEEKDPTKEEQIVNLNDFEKKLVKLINATVEQHFEKSKNVLSEKCKDKLKNITCPVKKSTLATGAFLYEARVPCACRSTTVTAHFSAGNWIVSNYSRHILKIHIDSLKISRQQTLMEKFSNIDKNKILNESRYELINKSVSEQTTEKANENLDENN